MTQAIRIFTKSTLRKVNPIAIKRGYNKASTDRGLIRHTDSLDSRIGIWPMTINSMIDKMR